MRCPSRWKSRYWCQIRWSSGCSCRHFEICWDTRGGQHADWHSQRKQPNASAIFASTSKSRSRLVPLCFLCKCGSAHQEEDGGPHREAAQALVPLGHAQVGPVHVPRLRRPRRDPQLRHHTQPVTSAQMGGRDGANAGWQGERSSECIVDAPRRKPSDSYRRFDIREVTTTIQFAY